MRIGIFGGTFDPIHNGHLMLATYAKHEIGLSHIFFVPTYKPPSWYKTDISHIKHRLLMLIMCMESEKFFLDKCEIKRKGISHTIDTVKYFKKFIPDEELFFITGPEATENIHLWKDSEEIKKYVNVVIANKDFYCPNISIRGTSIRQLIKDRKPISYLVPKQVEKYIIEKGLYK